MMILLLPLVVTLVAVLALCNSNHSSDSQLANCGIIGTAAISLALFVTLWRGYGQQITLLTISDTLSISLHVDGLTVVFAALVGVLWPIATYYAKSYMTHEGKFKRFYTFYTLTYGVVIGLAMSQNLLTLYLFYELLTFVTLPLVTHNSGERDRHAGRQYIYYMMFGASLSFAGMSIFVVTVGSLDFVAGGLTAALTSKQLVAYVLLFLGFGVKAGMFPFHRWLIGAGVAPTTVTALLHAVAVVKSGAFATMRLTYYLYDPTVLRGTVAQTIVMGLVIFSVVYGSLQASRSRHLKRRLAYSTVSQLSYILLGVTTMSLWGLQAALLHMVFHAFMKIVLFYDAGNVIFANHAEFVDDVKGFGPVMKATCLTFTISGLALLGIPPLGGFFSKFALTQSAIDVGGTLGLLAVVALCLSAFCTAIYIFQIVLNFYLPTHGNSLHSHLSDTPKPMRYTVTILTVMMVGLSLGAGQLYDTIGILIKGVG